MTKITELSLEFNPLVSERVSLRLMQATDSAFIIELLNEADFITNIGDKGVRTTEDALQYMNNGPLLCQRVNGFSLMLVCLSSGQPIGMCGLLKREALPNPDIGYAFLAKYYRQGYAYESCQAVLSHFKTLRPLSAMTNKNNQASRALLEKLGFHLESISTDDKGIDICLFNLDN